MKLITLILTLLLAPILAGPPAAAQSTPVHVTLGESRIYSYGRGASVSEDRDNCVLMVRATRVIGTGQTDFSYHQSGELHTFDYVGIWTDQQIPERFRT